MLLESKDTIGDAIYTFAGTDAEVAQTEGVINNLKSMVHDNKSDLLEHHFQSREEIGARGYDAGHVRKAAIFPKDGNFPPYLDEELEKLIKDRGGQVCGQSEVSIIRSSKFDLSFLLIILGCNSIAI